MDAFEAELSDVEIDPDTGIGFLLFREKSGASLLVNIPLSDLYRLRERISARLVEAKLPADRGSA